MIDPHVHFRDFKQKYKETIKHGLELAEEQGIEFLICQTQTHQFYQKMMSKED
jgi:dihydroorotase-like cyclic amidohydrolase